MAAFAIFVSLFLMPNFKSLESQGDNIFTIYLNGTKVGVSGSVEDANESFLEARRTINSESESLTFIDVIMTYEGDEVLFGAIDSKETIQANMEAVMRGALASNLVKAYEVKINDYTVTLSSSDEVITLLQAAVDKYDETKSYRATLVSDGDRELSVLKPMLNTIEDIKAEETAKETEGMQAGFEQDMITFFDEIEPNRELELEEYDTGMESMEFKDSVEVVEVYVNSEQLTDLPDAINAVTAEELQNDVYKVVSGDTLSGIAIKVNIPMEDIIAMNDSLEDARSLIRPNDELIITVAKPKLTVVTKDVMYYEENYTEDTIIHWDPDKFTTDVTTLIQPSDGHRKVVAEVTLENGQRVATNILAQEVTVAAVAKEIIKGEKTPPTYIRPISGGRLTSSFGRRNRPTAGASTNHKGVDWGTPTGTPVYASCGGTVARAGWGGGYGYCVYINHPDGKQTRYAHLSKVLVSAGQSVSQGQLIARSGSTGVSTGPHLHFEILVNGVSVNPLQYVGY